MWTANRKLDQHAAPQGAALGTVTLGGDPAGVYLGGERRGVAVYAPGGYQWQPVPGDRVLLVQAGDQRETPCLVGAQPPQKPLSPGEVRIQGGSGEMYLHEHGIALSGSVSVNGETLEQMILRVAARLL